MSLNRTFLSKVEAPSFAFVWFRSLWIGCSSRASSDGLLKDDSFRTRLDLRMSLSRTLFSKMETPWFDFEEFASSWIGCSDPVSQSLSDLILTLHLFIFLGFVAGPCLFFLLFFFACLFSGGPVAVDEEECASTVDALQLGSKWENLICSNGVLLRSLWYDLSDEEDILRILRFHDFFDFWNYKKLLYEALVVP